MGVHRTEIAARLAHAGAVRLVLVRAPAGFGKTTAMVQLREALQQRGVATAWLTLDRSHNDVPRFLAALGSAAAHLGMDRPVDADALSLLAAEPGPFTLFLDDLEAIRDDGVMSMIRELIERLPRNGQLVVASRKLPELGLGRLRARGQLLEIDTDLLRFTHTETREFFMLCGMELSLEAIDLVHGKTEGWAAALWLLSLALQREDGASNEVVARLSSSDRDVADYLTEEVLAQQSSAVRDFLLRTSVLRRLSAAACQALLPYVDCAGMLDTLQRGNVFLVPIADAPDEYRYHSLFAGFLRKLLARERPDEVTRLHLAASGWYESQARPVPAIDHAIEGGDHPHALDLLEPAAHALLEQGRMRLLDRWFSAIPADQLHQRPLLQVTAVWARCFTQGPWAAMEWLQRSGSERSADAQVQAHVRALRPVLLAMMDCNEEAHAAARDGLARLPSGNPFLDSALFNVTAHIVSVVGQRHEAYSFLEDARRSHANSSFNRMYTETVNGMLDLREGRLRQATARFRMAVTSASTASAYNYSHGNAWAGVPYAGVLYEANDLAGAQRLLNVYLPLARDVGLPDHMISSYRMRSRIAFQQGDIDTALQSLAELEYLGLQRQLPRVVASARLERSRLLGLQGHGQAAREEFERAAAMTVWEGIGEQYRPAQDVDDLLIGRMRLELLFGPATELVPGLESAIGQAERDQRLHRALKLRLLLAAALLRMRDVARAVDESLAALREASREGFWRLLLDEGAIIGPVLRQAKLAVAETEQDPVFRDYVERLTDLLGPAADKPQADSASIDGIAEPLTRKEVHVVRLLAEGYSNMAIAEKLFVSTSTVRTHLRNINVKLNCHNRTQAVAIARRLGLLR
ncbi:MAG: LuxR C-terminal-related transcriptional regulator [Bradyrhizobium sp.]|uniref:LuxR C-terminal-related transcriptional regulator n=1 Tax=Bradyrhizobium sp. TaxID=376 RepID=UPI003D0FEE43